MKVWIGYYCTHNLCDTWKTVEKVFDDEVKALIWAEDPEFARTVQKWNDTEALEWREYAAMEVE